MQVKLTIIKGPEKGKVFSVSEPSICLAGRSRDARFQLSGDDPYISRRHFLLEVAPPKVYFRDLDVTNPSKINNLCVDEVELKDGDIIEVGYTQLCVALEMALSTHTRKCAQCGKSMHLLDDEKDILCCPQCDQAPSQASHPPSDPGKLPEIRCRCGKDLIHLADSDHRAIELHHIAMYTCPKCLPPRSPGSGHRIDGFEVIRQLGQGGMGKVYLVYHKATARLLALKEMNIDNPHLGARFTREIKLMQKVRHDNVLRYIDRGQNKKTGKPYMVMEYAAQGSLNDVIAKERVHLSANQAVGHVIEALEGLMHVHAQGIVHRDIKPDNILLKNNSGDRSVSKLADFGLARQFSKAGGTILTQLGAAMGTVLYMAPEQFLDAHNVREPADIYAMGVTLYHLLTGKYPFRFPTPQEVLQYLAQHKGKVGSPKEALQRIMKAQQLKAPHLILLEEAPIPVQERAPEIPAALAAAVDKSIQKKVSQRYQSAKEFMHALEKAV